MNKDSWFKTDTCLDTFGTAVCKKNRFWLVLSDILFDSHSFTVPGSPITHSYIVEIGCIHMPAQWLIRVRDVLNLWPKVKGYYLLNWAHFVPKVGSNCHLMIQAVFIFFCFGLIFSRYWLICNPICFVGIQHFEMTFFFVDLLQKSRKFCLWFSFIKNGLWTSLRNDCLCPRNYLLLCISLYYESKS